MFLYLIVISLIFSFKKNHTGLVFPPVIFLCATFHDHLMSLCRNTCFSVIKEWCTILVITVCPVCSKMQHRIRV